MENFFTILGGMGTLATESFIHTLNERTEAYRDQDYLNYIVVNHATIPDRTDYIKNPSLENPEEKLIDDIKIHSQLSPKIFVVPCNTAHYYLRCKKQQKFRFYICHALPLIVLAITFQKLRGWPC